MRICRTASVPTVPYGDSASRLASVIDGAGMTSSGLPGPALSLCSAMAPFSRDVAVRPWVVSVKS
ncbi:hypothetical protein SGLAM104S_04213 [Streptomyces glaucescens]